MNTDQIAAEAANKLEAAFHCGPRDVKRFAAIIKSAIEKATEDCRSTNRMLDRWLKELRASYATEGKHASETVTWKDHVAAIKKAYIQGYNDCDCELNGKPAHASEAVRPLILDPEHYPEDKAQVERERAAHASEDDARTVILRGVAIMTEEQVSQWEGVRSWLEQAPYSAHASEQHIVVTANSPAANELLHRAVKWIDRLCERKASIPSFFDNDTDPCPLAKDIRKYLLQPAHASEQGAVGLLHRLLDTSRDVSGTFPTEAHLQARKAAVEFLSQRPTPATASEPKHSTMGEGANRSQRLRAHIPAHVSEHGAWTDEQRKALHDACYVLQKTIPEVTLDRLMLALSQRPTPATAGKDTESTFSLLRPETPATEGKELNE